jgi:hypothetical protein
MSTTHDINATLIAQAQVFSSYTATDRFASVCKKYGVETRIVATAVGNIIMVTNAVTDRQSKYFLQALYGISAGVFDFDALYRKYKASDVFPLREALLSFIRRWQCGESRVQEITKCEDHEDLLDHAETLQLLLWSKYTPTSSGGATVMPNSNSSKVELSPNSAPNAFGTALAADVLLAADQHLVRIKEQIQARVAIMKA